MSPIGRPKKGEARRESKLNLRVSKPELAKIQFCADAINGTRTDAVMAGINLLEAKIKENSEDHPPK